MLVLSWTVINHRQWENKNRVIANDAVIYYAYLPAAFIYKDLTLNFKNTINDDEVIVWAHKLDNGNYVLKMSMGMSMLYSPFFLGAHVYSLFTGKPANGYAPAYKLSLIFSSLTYLFLALILLRKFLRYHVKEITVGIIVLILVFATNLGYYTVIEGQMSHVYSFFLFTLFLLLTRSWHAHQKIVTTMALGLLMGLISLIRPTNVVIIIIFIFWNVYNTATIKHNISVFKSKFHHITLIAIFCVIVWIPQFVYWKYTTGSWLYYSYNDEGFFFTDPVFLKGLFSFRKGWLVYTPVMIFSIIGILYLFKIKHKYAIPVSIFTFVNLWIIFSWWSWWYGGSFGQRALIESYAILALPFAIFIDHIPKFKVFTKIIIITLLTVFSFLGIWNSIKYYYGSIHWQSMTKEAYFNAFWRTKPDKAFYQKLEIPDYESAKKGDR